MYGVSIAGTTVTEIIIGIQYGRITIILNEIDDTNAEIEGSLTRLWQNNTTNGNNVTTNSLITDR